MEACNPALRLYSPEEHMRVGHGVRKQESPPSGPTFIVVGLADRWFIAQRGLDGTYTPTHLTFEGSNAKERAISVCKVYLQQAKP